MSGVPLTERLERAAGSDPAAVALTCADRSVTYGELWRGVQAVAAFLGAQGLRKGERVAVLSENSAEYVIAYYGALLSGAIAVGLNAAAKPRDIVRWLEHCDAAWLFADGAYPGLEEIRRSERSRVRVVPLQNVHAGDGEAVLPEILNVYAGAAPGAPRLGEGDTAALVYTSGTTGSPKGVTLSHGNLAANVDAILRYLRLTPAESVSVVLPFYYAYGASLLHTHLAVGARLVLERSLMYPHRILQRIAAERVTGFAGVPSTYALLLTRTSFEDYDLGSLRYVTQAGGPMGPQWIARLREALPATALYVMYGQTEATARLTYLPPEDLDRKPGSVGVPVDGVRIEIRDPRGERLPPFSAGEICARGPNVMQAYWGNRELTEQVLVDGWLRTGDLGHVDAEGYVYVQGRASDMIKTGAHRVSPQETEEVIAELSG
ncbi:MAG: acyl--CoA ligase, partial [Gammaproteobacteria bacterium]|nr:acyl--CoA ligase [Gammaproteobacteria bacterium]NIR85953.1 acyl--CoA ligase [Gammaproteobacteria bacterium]NIU06405.1 acyl--CoA ligase [Gammaproteobacteria bacterium]NIV53299.1 AMP-binding protein [Gammaproteobacteria bacterium]NIV76956.1 AMP-binding protein [Gammaproteobacteria bacterium]